MESVLPLPDIGQIKRSLQVLFDDQDIIELRTIRNGDPPQHGYYSSRDQLATDAFGRSADSQTNCYVVLNRLLPEMTCLVTNDMGTGECTKDIHIQRRRWVLVDVDPVRDAGTSATDTEKAAAKQTARSVMAWLRTQGFPDPIVVDSGNGCHLLYPVDLDNTPAVKNTVRRFLGQLAARFDSAAVTIDQSVFNAARISKLPGTVARKGRHSDDRPHRTAQLLHVPDCLEAVDLGLLRQAAGASPEPDTTAPQTGDRWDIPALLKQHGIGYQHRAGYDTETGPADLYQLQECPWSAEHTTGAGGAAVIQFPSGAVSFKCQHSHCTSRTWEDFKAALGLPAGPDVEDLVFGSATPAVDLQDLQLDLPRPELDPSAYLGWLGQYALACGEHTEADPAAVLAQLLTMFGVVCGRNSYFTVATTQHFPKLFMALVGRTAKARKGLALDLAAHLVTQACEDFDQLKRGGLTSGEGVIDSVRDASWGLDKKGQPVQLHPGVDDKRGLFVEAELAAVFARMHRDGCTLSAVLRDVWDDRVLYVQTRKDPLRASGTHLAVISHISPEELRETLRPADIRNGLGNRFLWFYAERSRLLPRGGTLPDTTVSDLSEQLRQAVAFAQQSREIGMSDEAWQAWDALYGELDQDQDDPVLEGLSSRAAAQVRRLAMMYALSDRQADVQLSHLQAAVSCFEYSRATLQHVYVAGLDAEDARQILVQILARLGAGPASRTDIYNLFQRNVPGPKLRTVLTAAELRGLVRRRRDDTGGRPCDVFSLP